MTTVAYISGTTFKLGDGASPEVFTAIEEIISISGLGKTNPLIDATSLDSTAKEYIAGLSDGAEITLECNKVNTSSSQQANFKTAVNNGTNKNIQVVMTDGTTPETYSFAVIPLSWMNNPQVEDRNTVTFTMKITGAITQS